MIHQFVFIYINSRLLLNQIQLGRLHHLGSLDHFPSDVRNGSHDLHRVVLEECSDILWSEALVTVEQNHRSHCKNAHVGTVWLEITIIRKAASVDALHFARTVEVHVGDVYHQVVDQCSGCDKADKPVNDDGGAVR